MKREMSDSREYLVSGGRGERRRLRVDADVCLLSDGSARVVVGGVVVWMPSHLVAVMTEVAR